MSRRPFRPSPGLLVVLLLCAAFGAHARLFAFSMDDAFISLRYARNLVDGLGLVYNAGERVEGYSNFSWTILLALFLKAGLPPIETARWVGVGLAAAAAFVAARFTRAFEGRWGPAAAGTALLVTGSTPLAYWSASGMETALFVLLVTAGIDRALAPDVTPRGRRLAPVLFALAALTRPDGPLFFFGWLGLRALGAIRPRTGLDGGRGWRGLGADLAVFLAMVVPYAAWKVSYYGDLLPNTYHAKAGFSAEYLARGVEYLGEWARAYLLYGAVPALGLLALLDARHRAAIASAIALVAAYSAYVVVIGGDVLPIHRFWLTVVPVGSALVMLGVRQLVLRMGRAPAASWAALGVAVAATVLGLAGNQSDIQARRQADLRAFAKVRSIAEWLRDRLPPDATIASTSNGAIAWYSERPILDMLGLTDAEIARNPDPVPGLSDTWKEKKYNAASVLRRRPAVIVFSTGVRPSAMAEKALFLYDDFHRSYAPWEFRYEPRANAYEIVYRRRPDAPPPPARYEPVPEREFLEAFENALKAQARPDGAREALEELDRCVRTAPASFRMARAWRAIVADQAGLPQAQAWLEEAVAEDSLAVRAACALGRRLIDQDDVPRAKALFERASRANPDWSAAWDGLARTAWMEGDMRAVLGYAARSLQLWSANYSSLVLYGAAALELGDADRAEAAYRRALAVAPESADARSGLQAAQDLRARGGPAPPGGDASPAGPPPGAGSAGP